MIPMVLELVLDMLDSNEKQLVNFTAIRNRPHILSDDEINRCLELYSEMNEDARDFLNQCKKWRSFQLIGCQKEHVREIEETSQSLEKINNEILALVNNYKNLLK